MFAEAEIFSHPEPLVSVVICTHNRAHMLGECIQSVITQHVGGRFSFEVVVVDDGSTDCTPGLLKKLLRDTPVPIRAVCGPGKGVASARNRGIEEARGEWVAFLDDDELAEPDWLLQLMDVALKNSVRCLGGAVVLELSGEDAARYGPVRRSLLGEHCFAGRAGKLLGREVPSSGNLLIAKSLLAEAGNFDTNRSSGEDTELMLRFRAKGEALWSVPAAVVHHRTQHHRLKADYFRWVSQRWGAQFAAIDAKYYGVVWALALAVARVAKCLFLCLPLMLLAILCGSPAQWQDRRCQLWRTRAYVRMAFTLVAPGLLGLQRYFEGLDFRREGEIFTLSPK